MQVLIVDATAGRRQALRHFLQRARYVVELAATHAAAAERLAGRRYDFVLLAQTLPDGDGLALLSQAMQGPNHAASFVLFTASAAVEDRLRGFALGADDCLAPPVYLPELERRLRVIARQRFGLQRPVISFGAGFVMDLGARTVRYGPRAVHVSRKQFDLLHYLLCNRGRALTRRQLGAHLADESATATEASNYIDVQIMNVRRALATCAPADFLQTVRGVGYRAAWGCGCASA